QHGRIDAPPVRLARSFCRVPRKPCEPECQDSAGIARVDELRRMDRRAALAPAQGSRRTERGVLGRCGRGGGSEGRVDHSARKSSRRLSRVLWHEWRGAASAARLSTAPDGSWLRRDPSDQVLEADQGGRPLVHDLRRLRSHPAGSEGRGAHAHDRTDIGHHVSIRRTTAFDRGGSRAMGACTMAWRRLLLVVMVLAMSQLGSAQSPTYGVGRAPTAEEIRAWDITISPTGKELPPGHGAAKEGAQIYVQKGCAGCHGSTGSGGRAPTLISNKGAGAAASMPAS